VTRVVRSDERYRGAQDGVESWHCFAAGPHYDRANLGFGSLIGFDEHLVRPGSGFAWHGHRGVEIVSWVLAGTLHHEGSDGRVRIVEPGQVLWQSTGSGIRHCEVNASASDSLRLVQMTLLGAGAVPTAQLAVPPLDVDGARFDVWSGDGSVDAARWHVFVGAGSWTVAEHSLSAGDSVRGSGLLEPAGSGELLVWLL
jgi:hypothetical protein